MKMIWQLQNYIIILATFNSLSYTKMTATGTSCYEICDVSGFTANCDNRVNHVPRECYAVKVLTIADNVIHEISDATFQNFTRLTILSMANNGIDTISDNSFNRTKLRDVDLSDNHIVTLSDSVFRPLTNLTRLILNHNDLRSVALQDLAKLQHLSLSHNRISVLTRKNFTGTNLTFLDLSHNEITELVNDCLGKLTNLERLLLSGNRIESVNSNAFHYLSSLLTLKLDSNQLAGTIDGVIFEEQHKLEELNLSSNELTYLNENMFQNVRQSIKKILIQDNLISDIPRNTFRLQAKIVEIDLEGNRIGTNSQDAFIMILKTRTELEIKLAQNNICEAYVAEFKDYYGTGIFCLPDQTTKYSGMGKVSTTPGKKNTPGQVMSTEGPDALMIAIVVSGSILMVFIILAVVARVRNKFRRASSGVTNRGYNVPTQQHVEVHQIPMDDPPPPPVPPRNSTMNSGPYMNETMSSNSTQSYIQPSPATPSRGTCSHHKPPCHRHNRHPLPPLPAKCRSSPNLRTPTPEPGPVVIIGINHGGTGTAHTTGLPKLKRQWRRSLTKHLPGGLSGHYLTRRETKDGRPATPKDGEETTYLERNETIDGRPKHDTMGTAIYRSVHN